MKPTSNTQQMRKAAVLCCLLLCSVLLGGCWDRREVNDVAFVMGTGLDKEGDQYRVTMQIALPGQLGSSGSTGGGGGTRGTKSYYLESKTGPSFRGAIAEEQREVSRTLNYSHRRVLLFGEALAREGISKMMDVIARIPQNRLSSLIVITKGSAMEMLQADAPIEQYPAEMIRELNFSYMKEPRSVKLLMNSILLDGIDPVVPVMSLVKNGPASLKDRKTNIQIDGLAVFRQDRITGIIDNHLSRFLLLGMEQAKETEIFITPPKGKGYISVHLIENRVHIKPHIQGDEIRMTVRLDCNGNVKENETDFDISNEENLKWLEQQTAEEIKRELGEAVHVIQQKYHSDVLGLGRAIITSRPDEWKRIKPRWDQLYPKVEVTIDPVVHIENIGAVTKPFGYKKEQIQNE
ncbi:Ger(x)C family spore germination protein [Paenibacillus sp. CMAA1739]|uniref:Ger(x)C family spore germination protein n=1 Tax=Paenibacillus ottowii TaxID=2315729 RepID=UPI00272F8C27|nr:MULTISPECIES: Ger(x)C family spore germination protein [Paenibacillus]MDP1510378.1 Ger(x)C family spore germination protein [Paenibacillus ottowii]MEC4565794.1 Ger(x)C family spore germination protein [Paenibacillus sp. CMAA1739]